MTNYTALRNFVSGHLHEDYADVDGDEQQAVVRFALREPIHAPRLHRDVTALLAEGLTDTALGDRLFELGLGYRPTADGWPSYEAWLLDVVDRIEMIRADAGLGRTT